jgi:hypothetical protein
MDRKQPDDEYSPEEIAERMGRALKRALSMPPKPQRESSKKKIKSGRRRKRKLREDRRQ